MEPDSVALNKSWTEGLDTLAVQSRCAVQQDVLASDGFFKNLPDLWYAVLNQAASATNIEGELTGKESRNHERPEEFKGHVLGESALVKLQVGTHDDDRAARVVDALAEQVLTEVALLTLQIVGEALQGAMLGWRERTSGGTTLTDRVVDKRINGLLENTLLIAEYYLRRMDIDKFAQAIVAVDDPTIEIV